MAPLGRRRRKTLYRQVVVSSAASKATASLPGRCAYESARSPRSVDATLRGAVVATRRSIHVQRRRRCLEIPTPTPPFPSPPLVAFRRQHEPGCPAPIQPNYRLGLLFSTSSSCDISPTDSSSALLLSRSILAYSPTVFIYLLNL